MENKNLFSSSFKVFVRLASAIFICFIIVRALQIITGESGLYSSEMNMILPKNIALALLAVSAGLIIFVFVVPKFFWIFGVVALFYASAIFIDQPKNNLGIFIFIAGIQVLVLTGFFQKNSRLKTILFSLLYILLILSEIRFGWKIFLLSLISKTGFFLVTVFVILLSFHIGLGKVVFTSDKILDLSAFPDLTIRDAEWLRLVLKETKYDTIAREYNLTEGTVKNNFMRIFKTLGVQDRIHFMSVYGGCKIVDGSFRNARVTTFLKDIFWPQKERKGNPSSENQRLSDEENALELSESQEHLTE